MPKTTKPADKLFPADTKHKLGFLENRVIDLDNKYQRLMADYQNLQRHTEKKLIQALQLASTQIATHFFPVLDDLYRAQEHLNDPGLKLVIDSFNKVITDAGVTEINAVGQPFDADTMECVEVVDGPKNQVISVLTRGYQSADRVLRPARVTVGSQSNQ